MVACVANDLDLYSNNTLWRYYKNMGYNGSLEFLNMIKNSRKCPDTNDMKSFEDAHNKKNVSENTNLKTGLHKSGTVVAGAYDNETKQEFNIVSQTDNSRTSFIAVIDTETNWRDEVMSLGVALADASNYKCLEKRYYIFEPESFVGGMFSGVMEIGGTDPIKCRRDEAMADLGQFLTDNKISKIFAYNARFDQGHLPELGAFEWYDIMRIAAYRQYNSAIPDDLPCCKTGRLKSNYGVEPIMKLLTGNCRYCEKHNAVYDAVDELKIVELLGLPIESYEVARL
jgi:hypothetical protein